MREKAHEEWLVGFVRDRGGWPLKLRGLSGWPDYTVLLPGGKVLFIELKRDTKSRLQPLQEWTIRRLRGLGFPAFISSDREYISARIEDLISDEAPGQSSLEA